jgi:hypothetical protein
MDAFSVRDHHRSQRRETSEGQRSANSEQAASVDDLRKGSRAKLKPKGKLAQGCISIPRAAKPKTEDLRPLPKATSARDGRDEIWDPALNRHTHPDRSS